MEFNSIKSKTTKVTISKIVLKRYIIKLNDLCIKKKSPLNNSLHY